VPDARYRASARPCSTTTPPTAHGSNRLSTGLIGAVRLRPPRPSLFGAARLRPPRPQPLRRRTPYITATSYVSDHEGADGVDRVGVLGALVGAVAQDPGETEGHAARIAGRALHAVEGDLHHQLWTDLYGPLVRGTLGEFQE